MHRNDFQQAMIDLHGWSEQKAKDAVFYWLANSSRENMNKMRIVTGRGNHINSKGERGTLYKKFLSWVNESGFKDRIDRYEDHDGYFEVYLKPTRTETPLEKFLDNISEQLLNANIESIKQRAEEGDPESQVGYAKYLENHNPNDFKPIFKLYLTAAEKEFPLGMYEVGRCCLHGIGTKQSDTNAFKWFKEADKLGDIFATVALGDCYAFGHGIAPDARTAIALWAKAAKQKNPIALRKIASAYDQGMGVPRKNPELSFTYYKESADLGDVKSQYNVAVRYLNGGGVDPSEKNAIKYFKLSAEGGDPDAQCKLGQLLLRNNNNIDEKEAREWLKKAAEHGSSEANTLLARMTSGKDAEQYRKKAAETGNVILAITQQVEGKNLTDQEFDKIYDETIRKKSDLSVNDIILLDRTSRFFLIDEMLVSGKKKYKDKAFRAIHEMAEEKCIYSLRRLSFFYLQGFPELQIKQDSTKLIECLQKGVAWGDPKAMGLLGLCYLKGRGVAKSESKALEYYQMAAKHHHPNAYYSIAHLEVEKLRTRPQDANIEMIIEYLELAIKYENDKEITHDLASGQLDSYKPIADDAKQLLEYMQKMLHDWHIYEQKQKPQQSTTKIIATLSKEEKITAPVIKNEAPVPPKEPVIAKPAVTQENKEIYYEVPELSCNLI